MVNYRSIWRGRRNLCFVLKGGAASDSGRPAGRPYRFFPRVVARFLHLVLSETGEVAAFCTAWLEQENGVAEFEPVGTVPGYRKRGLGAAVMAEACHRLRSLGCRKVTVNSWSESVGANKLYEAAGLQAKGKINSWQWKGRPVRPPIGGDTTSRKSDCLPRDPRGILGP